MSLGWIILIVVLVIGVVLGNILLLRSSARFKLPSGYKPPKPGDNRGFEDVDEEDNWGSSASTSKPPSNQTDTPDDHTPKH